MAAVAVLSASGKKLMPTTPYRARKLIRSGRAVIHKHYPILTIRLLQRRDGDVQPIEYKNDTGYLHIGVSICSQKHEYVGEQRDTLADEPEMHNNRRKYRRARRNRLRYREPRPLKDTKQEGWFPPSIRHREEIHIRTFLEYLAVLPITSAYLEMGQFDTQLLKAMEEGRPVPQGTDYQQGERYGSETQRLAVLTRDNYTCTCCGKSSIGDGARLHIHHVGFWKNDRTNRMGNLATVCDSCHIPSNHKPGGRLWGWEPKLKDFKGATYMTAVRWDMLAKIRAAAPEVKVHVTYGAKTKLAREELGIEKSHVNDAYTMGEYHPTDRAEFRHLRKRRRNNRCLEKFYDAVYIDTRDGTEKKGSQLSCNHEKRSESRREEKSERKYRGKKVTTGRRAVRKARYFYQPGMRAVYHGKTYCINGTNNKGKSVLLEDIRIVPLKEAEEAAGDEVLKVGRMIKYQKGKRKVAAIDRISGTVTLVYLISTKPGNLKPISLKNGWDIVEK